MAFSIEKESYSEKTDLYRIFKGEEPLTYNILAQDLESETENILKGLISDILKDSQFKAFFWEFAPVVPIEAKDTAVSFAITQSKQLEKIEQNSRPFKKHISKARELDVDVAVFKSLGGDAELIIPAPSANDEMLGYYSHIAGFVRNGKETEIFSLFRVLGNKLNERFIDKEKMRSAKPLWISTSGLGVYFLHLRLDSRPKYYVHKPFK